MARFVFTRHKVIKGTHNMSDAHEEHESFIKTPQQLIVIVVLSFVVFVGVAVLVAQFVLSGFKGLDSANPEIIAKAIQPVARVELGEAESASAGPKTGSQIYKAACAACHDAGAAGAPKLGDNAAWGSRIATGLEALVSSAVNGKGAMPAKGGNSALTEAEITRAVAYMANEAGANFAEPKAEAAAPAASLLLHRLRQNRRRPLCLRRWRCRQSPLPPMTTHRLPLRLPQQRASTARRSTTRPAQPAMPWAWPVRRSSATRVSGRRALRPGSIPWSATRSRARARCHAKGGNP
jgi:cytochrome c5